MRSMTTGAWILVALFVLMLVAFFPVWPYSAAWGYYPFAGLGLLFLLFMFLVLTGALLAAADEETVSRPGARDQPPE